MMKSFWDLAEAIKHKTFIFNVCIVLLSHGIDECLDQYRASGLHLYSKRDSGTGVFLWIYEISKNFFFTEHLQETASSEL